MRHQTVEMKKTARMLTGRKANRNTDLCFRTMEMGTMILEGDLSPCATQCDEAVTEKELSPYVTWKRSRIYC